MDYYNTDHEICQGLSADELLDNELIKKFTPKRQASELLAESYDRLGYESKAQRVSDCGTWLEWKRPVSAVSAPLSAPAEAVGTVDGWKLTNANFCRDRLCPMCSWRRSYKIFAQVSQIMNVIADDYVFLFLTLTVPNCTADELSNTIDRMQKAFNDFVNYKRVKTTVQGYFKALEVTRHNKHDNLYGTFHPHFHNIIAVRKSYFTSRDYIKHDEWLELWQKAMKDDSITQVHIERCKSKSCIQEGEQAVKALGAAVAEVAKYSVKSSDYLFSDDAETTDEVVMYLGAALHRRRLCAFGGVFEDVRKKLQLDDCENGDLVHVDGSELRSDVAYMIRRYNWSCGAYKLVEERREVNVDIDCEVDVYDS